MKKWTYVVIALGFLILVLDIFFSSLLFGLNNLLLIIALILVIVAYIADKRSGKKKGS